MSIAGIPDSEHEAFNQSGRNRLAGQVSVLRTGLMNDVFRFFQELHIEDVVERSRQHLGTYALWLTIDETEIPLSEQGDFRSSMAFAVRRPDGRESLRFHVPVPGNFDIDNHEAVIELAQPTEIYTQRLRYDRRYIGHTIARSVISEHQAYAYRTIVDTQGEERINPVNVWNEFHREYDSGVKIINDLNVDLINWKVTKQQIITEY